MKLLLKSFLILIILLTEIHAQFGFNSDIATMNAYFSFDKVHANSEFKVALKINISDTWHINSFKPNDPLLIPSEVKFGKDTQFKLKNLAFPKAKELNFSFSDKPVSVYEGEIIIGGIVKVPENISSGEYNIPIVFTYQACNDVSCMPPADIDTTLLISVVDDKTPINEINSEIFSQLNIDYSSNIAEDENSISSTLEKSGLLLSLLFVFLGGLALNLTPCVYPLIPITIGYFGGQSEGSTGKLFLLGLFYILGMALTYSIVGVITSLTGAVFGTLLQNPIVIVIIAAIFVILSLSMFGLYEFKLPDSWVEKAGGARTGIFGAFFMGLTMGIVAAPCIGPFVIGLVTYVAAKGDAIYGFWMFFVLALGLGFPYLILAVFSGKIKKLPRAGFWMDAVKHIFGFILIGMAIYFLSPLLPKNINSYVLPVYGILTSLFLLFFDKVANDIKVFRIIKIVISVVVILVSVYILIPSEKQSPDWKVYTEENYSASIGANKKIIVDFYADWCIPCKELDALTFSDKRVIELSKEFDTYKVDMTRSMSEETERIRNKFSIIGMPTVLLINSDGSESLRITGFVNADEFIKLMNNVK